MSYSPNSNAASAISFQATGSISSSNVQAAIAEVALEAGSNLGLAVSVTAKGATGNGVANDTTAVQLAITNAGANGTVVFPAGVYLIDTITGVNNQTWVGFGEAVIKLNSAGAYVNLQSRTGMTLKNLTFDGNNFIGATNGYMIQIGATSDTTITGCRFLNIYGSAINGGSSVRLRVSDCRFSDIGAWNGAGPVASNNAAGAAVYVTSPTDLSVVSCHIQRTLCDGAIFAANPTGAYIANNIVLDTFFGGIHIFAVPGATTVSAVQICGNHLERIGSLNNTSNGVGANAVYLRGAIGVEQIVVENNYIKGVCENGIEASTRPATIRNNTVIGTGLYPTAATPSTEGIWASNGSIVQGNTIQDTDLEGIYFYSLTTISNTIITDNIIINSGRLSKNTAQGPSRSGAITFNANAASPNAVSSTWITRNMIDNSIGRMASSINVLATGSGGTVATSTIVTNNLARGAAMTNSLGASTTSGNIL